MDPAPPTITTGTPGIPPSSTITDSNGTTNTNSNSNNSNRRWVRGVNVGGWLTLERYITPYQFAITDCHLRGDLCWYPGQVSAPPPPSSSSRSSSSSSSSSEYKVCDPTLCRPARQPHPDLDGDGGALDYPLDEYTLASAFREHAGTDSSTGSTTEGAEEEDAGTRWLNHHFENFVTAKDVAALREAGVTHVRVPLPHWILGDVEADEPWIVGDRWTYFARFCRWCRQAGIEVWPDLHTAPGSQNGFDNSGQSLRYVTCKGWSSNPPRVERTLRILQSIADRIVADGLQDVVTGFGLLNEPFKDCDRDVYLRYIDAGFQIMRDALGKDVAVYVTDLFMANTFNNGKWKWLGLRNATATTYSNTYLDSHFYHVFAEHPRAMSPRQHIAYVCENEFRDATSCCYADYPRNTKPAHGVKRMVGEWSAACDTLPMAKLGDIMERIATNFTAPELDRKLSPSRQQFLQHFVQSQMVTYEAADVGTSGAWFYWTLKMEGGAFAEWDFLRGVREKWIPSPLPPPNVTSQSLYGTCYDIIFRTDDSMEVIHEFPDPRTLPDNAQDVPIDDDVVLTHGDSLLPGGRGRNPIRPIHHTGLSSTVAWLLYATIVCFAAFVLRMFWKKRHGRKAQYVPIEAEISV